MSRIIGAARLAELQTRGQLNLGELVEVCNALDRALRMEREQQREEWDLLNGFGSVLALYETKDRLRAVDVVPGYVEGKPPLRMVQRLVNESPRLRDWTTETTVPVEVTTERRCYELRGFATVRGRRVLRYVEV